MFDLKKELAERAAGNAEARRLVEWYWSDKNDPRDANLKRWAFQELDSMDRLFAKLAAKLPPETVQ